MAADLNPTELRRRMDAALDNFLEDKRLLADPTVRPAIEVLASFVASGGKRLRGLLCVYGWRASDGGVDESVAITAAASIELFHTFAIIHDDIMDRSDTRRGRPSVHRRLAAAAATGGPEIADWFGVSAAILLGDLALVWSDELLGASIAGDGARVRPILDAMRSEIMFGQYLDLALANASADDLDAVLRAAHFKTAKYTVERPLHLGAALAGADQRILDVCTEYAIPVGEAFQFRDDLLGVFGDPQVTGKSNLDDLRAGKRTVLIAIAAKHADHAQRVVLRELLGNPDLDEDGADAVRTVLERTGARRDVEEMIATRRARALHALTRSGFPERVVRGLRQFAVEATDRTH